MGPWYSFRPHPVVCRVGLTANSAHLINNLYSGAMKNEKGIKHHEYLYFYQETGRMLRKQGRRREVESHANSM